MRQRVSGCVRHGAVGIDVASRSLALRACCEGFGERQDDACVCVCTVLAVDMANQGKAWSMDLA